VIAIVALPAPSSGINGAASNGADLLEQVVVVVVVMVAVVVVVAAAAAGVSHGDE